MALRRVLLLVIAVLAAALVALIGWVVIDAGSGGAEDVSASATEPPVSVILQPQIGPLDRSTAGPTSLVELCGAYRRASAVTVEGGHYDAPTIGPDVRALAAAARNYPDAGIAAEAPLLELLARDGMDYPRDFYGATLNIAAACR